MSLRFSARKWVEFEIFSAMDLYGNSRPETIEAVKDRLEEGEYMEELTDRQIRAALAFIRGVS